jgi:formylmethanofuran dehydrogenase subunit C
MAVTEVILTSRGSVGIMLEAEVISPDMFQGKSREEIERLTVWQGPAKLPLVEFFEVQVRQDGGAEETKIVIESDAARVKRIGQGMKTGSIEINGSAGMHLGAEMAGGSILVKGNVASWAGMEMKGGAIHVLGSAEDHVGCAYRGSWRGMTGGQIVIDKDARSQLGGGMAGGQIVVSGDVENFCGIRQSGGTIMIKGSAVRGLGAEMNGGTIAVEGKIRQMCPGFVAAGRDENPKLGEIELSGGYTRFTGDYAISKNPKGTLLLREG